MIMFLISMLLSVGFLVAWALCRTAAEPEPPAFLRDEVDP